MFLNYLKLSLRLMARNPFFTFIKVSGLAIGLAMFFILWQYTQNELNSDRQWKDSDRTYRFGGSIKWTDDKVNWEQSYFATNIASLSEQITQQYPEITEVTRILFQRNFTGPAKEKSYVGDHGTDLFLSVQTGSDKKSFKESGIVYADPNLFTFFELPMVEGQPGSVLDLAGSVVLSEALSIKYFGTTHSIGKAILLNDQISLSVAGVFKNLPRNTHLSFDAVISSERIKNRYPNGGAGIAPVHYIKTGKGVDIRALSKKINADMHPQIRNAYFGDWPYGDAEVYFQPLSEMPFQSYIQDDYITKSALVLGIFQSAAIAILLLAWINYINLTGAFNLKRIKEVATRRIIGAKAGELVAQFVVEALVVNIIALLLALTIVQSVKTPLELLVGFYILPWVSLLQSGVCILTGVFATGVLVTGVYPAWVVMRQRSTSLSGMIHQKKSGPGSLLTTVQYTVAISIVIFAFAIRGQLNFILTSDIGFNKEEIVVVDLPLNRSPNFKVDLKDFMDRVKEMGPSVSREVPGDVSTGLINLIQPGIGAGIGVSGEGGIDENFIPLYNIKMIEGRNFLPDHPADSTSILLSEITATRLGFETAADAIGREVIAGVNGNETPVTVVGIFADYKTQPLLNMGFYQSKGAALTYKDFLFADESWSTPQKVSFRIRPEVFRESLAKIESAYREVYSDPLFSWYFLDTILDQKYHQHLFAGNQIMMFSFLAVGIACLGLLGMMVHRVHNKIKEIGIRKVLGAELHQIAQLLLSATFKQVIFSSTLGIPIAYYLMQQYLEKFSERIQLQWWHFAFPVVMLVLIMLCTVATVVWKAARNNPVDALKYE